MKKNAILFRMVNEKHICPFGIRSLDLLKREGFQVEDNHLKSREETDAFKSMHDVKTTPQVFIDDQRIGGYDDLRTFLGMGPAVKPGLSYRPVIMIFVMALLTTIAALTAMGHSLLSMKTAEWFVAMSMVFLALQKLKDLYSFTNSFITYDLLAMKFVRYGALYPFLEAYAGLGMLAGFPPLVVAPVSLFIGTIGGISVYKAVYIDKRELKCACVGGDSKVPLGFVSLTENIIMVVAGLWMLSKVL